MYLGIIRIGANLAMVAAVFVAMFAASRYHAWPSELIFCACFFGLTIPVWAAAFLLGRLVRKKWPVPPESLVLLPGVGETLVRWTVSPSRYRPGLQPDR